jgi:hypothetical protein
VFSNGNSFTAGYRSAGDTMVVGLVRLQGERVIFEDFASSLLTPVPAAALY